MIARITSCARASACYSAAPVYSDPARRGAIPPRNTHCETIRFVCDQCARGFSKWTQAQDTPSVRDSLCYACAWCNVHAMMCIKPHFIVPL